MDIVLPAFFASFFATVGGLAVWFVQSRAERLRRQEEGLRDRRLRLYADAMDPFVRLLAGIGEPETVAKVLGEIQGYRYRKVVFDFTMFGSDAVVHAYNRLLQEVYASPATNPNPRELVRLWGRLLLAIRRSGGSPKTGLDEWDMLAALIRDVEIQRAA